MSATCRPPTTHLLRTLLAAIAKSDSPRARALHQLQVPPTLEPVLEAVAIPIANIIIGMGNVFSLAQRGDDEACAAEYRRVRELAAAAETMLERTCEEHGVCVEHVADFMAAVKVRLVASLSTPTPAAN